MRRSVFRKSVCLVVLAAAIGVASAFWLWPAPPSTATTPSVETEPVRPSPVPAEDVGMDTEALLDDPRCRLHRGAGAARDAAAAVVTGDADARFLVLDRSGTVFAGELPFAAERALLGRRSDGAVAAAFGGGDQVRLKVFLDGEVVADEHGVLDFGLSPDGVAWFLVRRNPEGEFEVEQHDTATGGRHTFSAGWLRDTSEGLSHTGAYARTDNGIVFTPRVQDDSIENAHYIHTVDGKTRQVRLKLQAVLESDSHVYALDRWHQEHGLDKRVFHWDAKGKDRIVEVWWRTVAVAPATVRMFLSDDGAWLGLFGWNLVVLDAETGAEALSFPVHGDKSAELARLGNVLAPDATVRDVGRAKSARIAHGMLLVRRTVPVRDSVDGGATEDVVDVFHMANLQADAGPDMRVAADDVNRCLVDTVGFPLPFVHVDADRVAYVPAGHSSAGGFRRL